MMKRLGHRTAEQNSKHTLSNKKERKAGAKEMKEFFRALFVVALIACVSVVFTGCRKKAKDVPELVPGENPLENIDNLPFTADVNTEVYGKPVYFDFDKSDIKDEAKPILEAIAMDMKANTKKYLRVEGNCDERGTNEYNLALGERRALSVRQYLISLGVSDGRIATITYGEEKPADQGHDEAAWAKNRRAEFTTCDKQ
jgi:peptidoglycan-associated lipoprotein